MDAALADEMIGKAADLGQVLIVRESRVATAQSVSLFIVYLPSPGPEWTPSDVATVVIAAVALIVSIVSIVSTILIDRRQGPVIRLDIRFHGDYRDKATYVANAADPDNQPKYLATTALNRIDDALARFPDDKFYQTTFLRVVVTNTGRADTSVDNVSYVNKAKKGVATRKASSPPGPILLRAQSYITEDYLYKELLSHAGETKKIRFVVSLANGKQVKSRFVKLQAKYGKP